MGKSGNIRNPTKEAIKQQHSRAYFTGFIGFYLYFHPGGAGGYGAEPGERWLEPRWKWQWAGIGGQNVPVQRAADAQGEQSEEGAQADHRAGRER